MATHLRPLGMTRKSAHFTNLTPNSHSPHSTHGRRAWLCLPTLRSAICKRCCATPVDSSAWLCYTSHKRSLFSKRTTMLTTLLDSAKELTLRRWSCFEVASSTSSTTLGQTCPRPPEALPNVYACSNAATTNVPWRTRCTTVSWP